MEIIGNEIKQNLSNKFSCNICNYLTSRKSNLQTHYNSIKHKNKQLEINGNQVKQNLSNKYSCKECNYYTCRKSNLQNHFRSNKHICLIQQLSKQETSNQFTCNNCSKMYHSASGLWKHNKTCKSNIVANGIDKDFILALFNSNQEFQKSMFELFKEKTTNNSHNNTNNSHNKSFNLQFFLNETCKDAMNISEFVSSIVPTIEDLETTGRLGYAEGVSKIFIKKLNELGTDYRPVHCTDEKREVLYIKENNTWNKETEEKPILTKAIKQVAYKNIGKIIEWQKMYPDCTDSDSRKNDLYLNIVSNSMPGSSIEESEQNYKKIINKITKEVVVDKD